MPLAESYAEVLSIINTAGTAGITCVDIFKKTKDNKITHVTDPAHVSNICFKIRSENLITSFLANKKNHQVITQKGIAALDEYNQHIDGQLSKELQAEATAAEIAADRSEPKPEKTTKAELENAQEELADLGVDVLINGISDAELAVKVAKEHGYTVLDPLDDLHKPLIDLIAMLEAASTLQPLAISDKFVKIDTLKRVGNIMSDDIKHIFDAIIPDLEQLEELEQE